MAAISNESLDLAVGPLGTARLSGNDPGTRRYPVSQRRPTSRRGSLPVRAPAKAGERQMLSSRLYNENRKGASAWDRRPSGIILRLLA